MQTYTIDATFAALSRAAVWILAALTLIVLAVPLVFLPGAPAYIQTLSAAGTMICAALAAWAFQIARTLPRAGISVDEDGLWRAHAPKHESLVRWERVHALRERPLLQRLELLDATGEPLIHLEYQLRDFASLRALAVEKTRGAAGGALPPARFGKRPLWHLAYAAGAVIFGSLALFVGASDPLWGYGAGSLIVALIAWEYLTTVSSIALAADHLTIGYPLRALRVSREDVAGVRIDDHFDEGYRHPEVRLSVVGRRKPLKLRGLGVGAVELYAVLRRWRERQ